MARPLYPRDRPDTHCIGGWVGTMTSLNGCRKSRPHRDSIFGPSSPFQLHYSLFLRAIVWRKADLSLPSGTGWPFKDRTLLSYIQTLLLLHRWANTTFYIVMINLGSRVRTLLGAWMSTTCLCRCWIAIRGLHVKMSNSLQSSFLTLSVPN
jgi:hypothetical protein